MKTAEAGLDPAIFMRYSIGMKDYKTDTWFFDMEVLPHDWLFCTLHMDGRRKMFHNEPNELYEWIKTEKPLLCGYNAKGYDIHIVRAICIGATPEECKEVSDYIVNEGNPWKLELGRIEFDYYDLMLDMPQRQSLKMLEGNLSMDIVESEVDFDTQELTPELFDQLVKYCWHDVEALIKVWECRKSYLEGKALIGELMGMSPNKALSMTNAQLTAKYLHAVKGDYSSPDNRHYEYPSNLNMELIPPSVKAFFDKYNDLSISGDELFGKSLTSENEDGDIIVTKNPNRNLEVIIGDCPSVIAWGGIHGAQRNFFAESDDEYVILNYDVTSYYPSLMLAGWLSRAVPNPDEFRRLFEDRVEAKRAGNKAKSNALKQIINTVSGATDAKFNPLYDPDMAYGMRISGQLYLVELCEHLYHGIKNLKVVQLNTDGIMIMCRRADHEAVRTIVEEWSDRTTFGMEEDIIQKVAQKDVNNYAIRMSNGDVKVKGGFLNVYGRKPDERFTSNSMYIVAKAIVLYLLDGVPVADTINECNDPELFMRIDKTGGNYTGCWYETLDEIEV